MRVIFLSIGGFKSITDHDQYPDLLREFQNKGHEVYVVCANEKRTNLKTELIEDNGAKILRVRIGNITKSSMLEKGLATITIGMHYKRAILKYFGDVEFDLILYTTPPITLVNVVRFLKNRSNARTYLLLKDIFPQNAVDLGLMKTSGFKSIIYKCFREQEKRLYRISDNIGTMSIANTDYIIMNNPNINPQVVEECPNCLDIRPIIISTEERNMWRDKYGIPKDSIVFVYGGNLGKPQDIPFVLDCIKASSSISDVFFWIIGDGTEFDRISSFIKEERLKNVKLSCRLPKEEYDSLIASCDVGLIFLDHRFTIPNFPSRMLSYMQAGLPVLACTDINTDIGKVIVEGGFGWWCESDNVYNFINCIKTISYDEITMKSSNIEKNITKYSSCNPAEIILNSYNKTVTDYADKR